MVTIRAENSSDIGSREALLNRAFGVKRFRKTSEKLRAGRIAALAFTAVDAKGKLIGTVRLWNIIAGSAGTSLLLGPLAVDSKHQKSGVGRALMERLNWITIRFCWWGTRPIIRALVFHLPSPAACTCQARLIGPASWAWNSLSRHWMALKVWWHHQVKCSKHKE
jgi:GNAT superfamily N-acetyltransferase